MRVGEKAGRKNERRKEHAHSTLDHPYKIHRLCDTASAAGCRGWLDSGAGGTLSLTLFPFVGLGRGAVGYLLVLNTRLPLLLLLLRRRRRGRLQQRKRRQSHLPPSTSAQPHLSRNPDPSHPSPTPLHLPIPHLPLPKVHHTPMHDPIQVRAPAPRRAHPPPPPRGERTLHGPSLCTAGVLYGEGVGRMGTGVGAGLGAGRGCGKLGGRGRGLTRIRQAHVRGGSRAVSRPGTPGGRRGGPERPASVACHSWCDQT